MRRSLAVSFLVIFLVSCGLLPPAYDTNEYLILAQLETNSRLLHAECSTPNAVRSRLAIMVEDAELFSTYTFYQPRNNDTWEMAQIFLKNIKEFDQKYKKGDPSVTYCKIKTKVFTTATQRALMAVGKKSRN